MIKTSNRVSFIVDKSSKEWEGSTVLSEFSLGKKYDNDIFGYFSDVSECLVVDDKNHGFRFFPTCLFVSGVHERWDELLHVKSFNTKRKKLRGIAKYLVDKTIDEPETMYYNDNYHEEDFQVVFTLPGKIRKLLDSSLATKTYKEYRIFKDLPEEMDFEVKKKITFEICDNNIKGGDRFSIFFFLNEMVNHYLTTGEDLSIKDIYDVNIDRSDSENPLIYPHSQYTSLIKQWGKQYEKMDMSIHEHTNKIAEIVYGGVESRYRNHETMMFWELLLYGSSDFYNVLNAKSSVIASLKSVYFLDKVNDASELTSINRDFLPIVALALSRDSADYAWIKSSFEILEELDEAFQHVSKLDKKLMNRIISNLLMPLFYDIVYNRNFYNKTTKHIVCAIVVIAYIIVRIGHKNNGQLMNFFEDLTDESLRELPVSELLSLAERYIQYNGQVPLPLIINSSLVLD